jgi:protease I
VINPDALRLVPQAIDFVRHFVQEKKPIAAICHGPWTLIDAGGVSGNAAERQVITAAQIAGAANW